MRASRELARQGDADRTARRAVDAAGAAGVGCGRVEPHRHSRRAASDVRGPMVCASSACATGGPVEQARPALGRDDVIVEVEGKQRRVGGRPRGDRQRAISASKLLVTFDRGRERRVTVVEPSGTRVPDAAACRGAEGLGADHRPGADAAARRTPRSDRADRRSRDAGLRRRAAAAGRRRHSRR